jgi:hypothetical protein
MQPVMQSCRSVVVIPWHVTGTLSPPLLGRAEGFTVIGPDVSLVAYGAHGESPRKIIMIFLGGACDTTRAKRLAPITSLSHH